jgi:ABC-type transporter Mla subunit MlaD
VGTFDAQRSDLIDAMAALDRLTGSFNAQHDVLTRALHTIPPALDILIEQQPTITTALRELGTFSDIASRVVNETQADLVANLRNLEPTFCALANVGPELDKALAFLPTYPLPQDFINRAVRGDYINLFATLDLTVNRLKSGMFLGTRWGQEGLTLVPAPGDPGYDTFYTRNPLGVATAPPNPAAPGAPPPMPAPIGYPLPVTSGTGGGC